MIYVFGTLCSMFFAYIAVNLYRRKEYYRNHGVIAPMALSKFFCVLSILPLTVISAVRYGVGTDFFSYYRIYLKNGISSFQELENGFSAFVMFLNRISKEPQLFFVVSSFVIGICYFLIIYKESVSPVFSILLFVLTRDYFRSMNGVRQYLAIAILLLSLPYIKQKDWRKVIIFIGMATLFHSSALIYVLFYILVQMQLKLKDIAVMVFGTFLFAGTMKNIAIPIIDKYTTYGKYFETTSKYANANFEKRIFLIYFSFFLLLLYLTVIEKKKETENVNIFKNGIFLGMFFYALSIVWPTNVSRLGWYANSIITIYAPEAINCISKKWLRMVITYAVIICYMIITIPQILKGNQDVLPYQTFWQ